MQRWHHEDGWYVLYNVDVDGATTQIKLHVVSAYKHLGSILSIDGSDHQNAKHKACSAMAAYAPILYKVFS
eukprot:1037713-Karenia_brevis.AAC.1